MYPCFNCRKKAVFCKADFDFSDYDLEGDGIVHELECKNCGAEITYVCPAVMSAEGEEAGDNIPGQMNVEDVLNELL